MKENIYNQLTFLVKYIMSKLSLNKQVFKMY